MHVSVWQISIIKNRLASKTSCQVFRLSIFFPVFFESRIWGHQQCNLLRPRNNQEVIILRTLNSLTFTLVVVAFCFQTPPIGFHKSGDNRVTQYCRTQKISQMWFFGLKKLPRLLAVRSNQPQIISQKSKYPSERKKLTQQLNHCRWLESQVFVTRLPLQLCQKWSDFGCVKAKMTYFTLLSMQRLRQHNK